MQCHHHAGYSFDFLPKPLQGDKYGAHIFRQLYIFSQKYVNSLKKPPWTNRQQTYQKWVPNTMNYGMHKNTSVWPKRSLFDLLSCEKICHKRWSRSENIHDITINFSKNHQTGQTKVFLTDARCIVEQWPNTTAMSILLLLYLNDYNQEGKCLTNWAARFNLSCMVNSR